MKELNGEVCPECEGQKFFYYLEDGILLKEYCLNCQDHEDEEEEYDIME